MIRKWKRCTAIALAFAMIFTFVPYIGNVTAYADDQEPAQIQDTYVIDGVTYYNTESTAFTRDQNRFYKELLGKRSDRIKLSVPRTDVTDRNCSIADAWLLMGLALTQHKIDLPNNGLYETLARVAVDGSYEEEDDDGSLFIDGKRYDLTAATSLKKAEEYVLSYIHGDSAVEAQLSDKTTEEPVLVSAVNLKQGHKETTLAAYFTNFRVSPILPEDKGSNYVTTTVKDNVSTSNTTAYAIRNNTGSAISGSQSLSTSTSYSVSSSISGSESYSFSESIKYGGGYEFPVGVKLNIELGFSASQAVSEGWSEGKSHSDTKSNSQSVNVTLPPYTSVLLKTKTTEAEYVSRYNCPVALIYDVTLVSYDAYRVSSSDPVQYAMFTFENQTGGARADILERSKLPETYSDDDGIAWNGSYNFLDYLKRGYYWCQYDVMDYVSGYVPMSSTGASFRDSATIVSSEVEEFMPLLPLRRIKITEPNIGVISSEKNYGSYTYYTAKMEVGDYSFANYMTLVGLNEKDAAYYGFSKDNGYWVLTDMDGNETDSDTAPLELVKDPVSGNWRYTAVRPGTCFLVFRINEDIYATADAPEDYMKNKDLKKTAALEIIVSEHEHTYGDWTVTKEATCTEDGSRERVCSGCGEKETENIPATGHDWEAATYTWADDNSTVTASRKCANDPSHIETETVGADYEVMTDATETRSGMGRYTSEEFRNSAFEPQTKDIEIPPTGYEVTYTWSEDNAKVFAKAVPYDTSLETITETLDANYTLREPTCTESGIEVWTTSEPENSQFAVQTKVNILDPLGHDLRYHEAKNATCTEHGWEAYETCSRCDHTTYKEIPATGHQWGEWEVVKAATEEAEGIEERVCRNDAEHIEQRTIAKLPKTEPAADEETPADPVNPADEETPADPVNPADEETPADPVNPAADDNTPADPVNPADDKTPADPVNPADDKTPADPATPAADDNTQAEDPAKEMSSDGTALGPGASAEAAEKAITSAKGNEDIKGSVYKRLRVRQYKATNTSVTVRWQKISGAKKYVVFAGKSGANYKVKKITTTTKLQYTLKKYNDKALTKGTYYKFAVVALDSNNKVITSSKFAHVATLGKNSRSNPAKVTTKAVDNKLTVKVNKTFKLAGTYASSAEKYKIYKVLGMRYESTNTKVATVTSKGVIKGIKKGTCYVYAYAQNGLAKKIKVTVTDSDEGLAKEMGSDGTALGTGASSEAAQKVITSAKGNKDIKGSVYKRLRVRQYKASKTSVTIRWQKISGAKKYVVYAGKSGANNKLKKITTTTKLQYTLKKYNNKALTKGTYYKFAVVALDTNNKVITSSRLAHVATLGKNSRSNPAKVTTKAKNNKVTVKVNKTFKLAGTYASSAKKYKIKKILGMRYESTKPAVATVSSKGVIKAKKKGTCYVYVFAQNGLYKRIKVTVKK